MKESITKFDLEAAFKALDELELPKVKGMRPNRMNLAESTKRVDRTSMLIEDYYDLQDNNDLQEASEERDAEVAQAKLARIEKIVDLNAKSPEELLPSYAGKAIIQCPQCMNIFFKETSDIEGTEGDISTVVIGDTVNAGEVCQHCGNDSGYVFSGWVEAEKPASEEEPAAEEEIETELEEIPEEEATEEAGEEIPEETEEESEEEVELEEIPDEEIPEEEEEKKEESFIQPTGETLNEQIETVLDESANDLDKKLEEYNEYIEILQAEIKKEEEAIKEAKNDFIKKMHEENLESLKAALDKAIPEEVKSEVEELPEADEIPEEAIEEPAEEEVKESLNEECSEEPVEEACCEKEAEQPIEEACEVEEKIEEACEQPIEEECTEEECAAKDDGSVKEAIEAECEIEESPCESVEVIEEQTEEAIEEPLEEEKLPELTDANVEKMLDSDEFKKPVSEAETEAYLDDVKEELDVAEIEDFNEKTFNEQITEYLNSVYKNVNNFETTSCNLKENKLIVEGNINFKSGKVNKTLFEFEIPTKKNNNEIILEGINKEFAEDKCFQLNAFLEDGGKTLMTESINYKYYINESLVEGSTRK